MIKIIGQIADKTEIEQIESDVKKYWEDKNAERKKENKKTLIKGVFIGSIVLLACICAYFALYNVNPYFPALCLIGAIAILFYGSMYVESEMWPMHTIDNSDYPAAYLFYRAIEGKQLLNVKTNSDRKAIILDIENNGVVESKWLYGFKTEMRNDINEITVDLKTEKIQLPYSKTD